MHTDTLNKMNNLPELRKAALGEVCDAWQCFASNEGIETKHHFTINTLQIPPSFQLNCVHGRASSKEKKSNALGESKHIT